MQIDKSRVSPRRFMFSVAFYLQSSVLLTSFLSGITRHESWIPVVIGMALFAPLVYLYRTFMVMFPEKNFLQVLCEIYGKVVGKVLGAAYLWFFLTLSALNVLDMGDFAKTTVLAETPHIVLTLCCVLITVWAVRNGFKVVSRYSCVFTAIEFAIIATSILLILNQAQWTNFLPLFTQPPIRYMQSTHIIVSIPFGELVVFLMIAPCVQKMSKRETTKCWFFGVLMGVSVLMAVLLRDISVLGNTLHLFALPGLVTLRLVDLGEALSRVEIIFSLGVMMLLFFKIAILVYVSTIAIAQFFETTQFKRLALVVGVLIVAYSSTLYPSVVEHAIAGRTVEPIIWTLFQIILPLLTFLIAKIKGASGAAAAKGQEASRP